MSGLNSTYRCLACNGLFTEKETVETENCPNCGTSIPPNPVALDVTVTLNWDNLRLLANWAFNWAEHAYRNDPSACAELGLILDKLRTCRPQDGEPLTLSDVVQELANMGVHVNPSQLEVEASYDYEEVDPVFGLVLDETEEEVEYCNPSKVYLN